MASVHKFNGRWQIQFEQGGKRSIVRLGDRVTKEQARLVGVRIQEIVGAAETGGQPPREALDWLGKIGPKLRGRLVKLGLAQGAAAPGALGAFFDSYIAGRTDIKPRTLANFNQARTDLIGFFGADRPLADITEGDAEEYWRHLIGPRQLAENTARRLCGRAKQLFRFAVRKRLIRDNPFAETKTRVKGNPDRKFYVTRAMADAVIEACPNAEWRLIVALSRYGGLRCPSETLLLTWGDVDWARGRLCVHSPKTEHHEGKEFRHVPIFPELRGPLEDAYALAGPDAKYVIARYRDRESNLRTQLLRIIAKAALTAWPKLFHNLRSTRQTELAETYPAHVVCAWLGNTEAIAQEHYLQVTDEHYERATMAPARGAGKNDAKNDAAPSRIGRTEAQMSNDDAQGTTDLPSGARRRAKVRSNLLPPVGVEPT